jgi:tetratricopeptide (TPR) repeat protein
MHTILAVALLFATPAGTWYEHYDQGLRLIQQGQAAAARNALQSALALRSKEGLQVATSPQEYIDYLPHLYLAIASQMAGDIEGARKHLTQAEDSGVAAKSEVGRSLLAAYQLLLRGDATGRYSRPAYAVYTVKPPLISEADFKQLREDVLAKCNVPPDSKSAPWYARYELGLELERKGDYSRALSELIEAVSLRPNPQQHARMYGMWLIDYYPYFHIARSHVRLANWQCAKNALDISQKVNEIPPASPEFHELLALQQETAKRLAEK